MNRTAKRILALLIILLVIFGWYFTIRGIPGVMDPIKDKVQLGLDIKGGVYAVLEADTGKLSGDKLQETMEQTKEVINERVNQMGLKEPTVTVEGMNRIRVELPGAEDSQEAIDTIGQTAQLEFRLANKSLIMTGDNVKDAGIDKDSKNGRYKVTLQFTSEGAKKFEQATRDAISGMVKSAYGNEKDSDKAEVKDNAIVILLDNKIKSAPTVEKIISGDSCEITSAGGFSQKEASKLSALIRGGALPVDLKVISSSTQSATIGMDALEKSVTAGLIGLLIVLIIMVAGYRMMGVAADIALLFYVVILVAIMAMMGSVLTLPGIAGIILSVGMAVDANVVIFSRIREEIIAGKAIPAATRIGSKRAMTTVIDSQVTTLIAAVVLYQMGTSSVKGFAWTLMIGIIVSIFTAVVVTNFYLGLLSTNSKFAKPGNFGIRADGTTTFNLKKQFHFLKYRKKTYIIPVIIILIGVGFFAFRGLNFGIDFTGGSMIQIDMGKVVDAEKVSGAVEHSGVDMSKGSVVLSGDKNNQVIIRTTDALDINKTNELVNTVGKELNAKNIKFLANDLFGGSVGKELRNNAIKAILIAAMCMLVYIRMRFSEWRFGLAAIIALCHDILILITFYLVFNVTVNNPFIAAVLTVVGYSINDTIVIFDRIRENAKYMRKMDRIDMIDVSINQTLGRSVMTSVTTLVVMIPLLIMGGNTIREFTLPLMVGVLVGCLSSIFIASPVYYDLTMFFEKKKKKNKSGGKKSKKKKYDGIKKAKDANSGAVV